MTIIEQDGIQHIFATEQLGKVTLCGIEAEPLPEGDDPFCGRCFKNLMMIQTLPFVATRASDTAQAVAIERNMTAMWLDKLGDDEMWADIATRYHLAAEAVRNGEHVKP